MPQAPPQPDIRFEPSGSIHIVQPLSHRGRDWVETHLAFEQWQVVGGTGVAVDRCAVENLRQKASDDGLLVE